MSGMRLVERPLIRGELLDTNCVMCSCPPHSLLCSECSVQCDNGKAGYYVESANSPKVQDAAVKVLNEMIDEASVSRDKKYDEGKPYVGLMKKDFAKALLAVATISKYGVDKYKSPGSWRHVEDALRRYEDALGRHDLLMGFEDHDEESRFLHAAHRAWNALATLEMILEEKDLEKHEDD